MDARLQEMLDHYEIRKTLKQYCQACDRGDELPMTSVYAEDSWDDHGRVKAPGPEFARATLASLSRNTDSMFHLLGQTTVNVRGDEAGAETYFIAVAPTSSEDGSRMLNQLGGRYVDVLHRVDGRWLISRRTVVRDWSITLPLEHEWEDVVPMTPGSRSNADPCFAALGKAHSASGPAAESPSGR